MPKTVKLKMQLSLVAIEEEEEGQHDIIEYSG